MRRAVPLLASVALAVVLSLALVLLSGAYTQHGGPTAEAQTAPARPNFVFILADDMRKDQLQYMPKTRSLLGQQGMTFADAYVSTALCCPSRATIMRGQYAHNTGVWSNTPSLQGGWDAYKLNGNENDNIATRLKAAGYRTALIGKYLNDDYNNTTHVPPGWDKWFATFTFDYFDYNINDNGTIRHFGTAESDYLTDVIKTQTQQFIGTSTSPFFAFVTPIAPHGSQMGAPVPAPRHVHAYDGEKGPRLPSFNEADVSDKPPWIRSLPQLSTTQIASGDKFHENQAESLQALDELVEGVVNTLQNSGQLSNTYIVFTSDNGIFRGEHRIPNDKGRPYEEDVDMPLFIRGPGVAAGSSTAELVLNTDYFPTFTDLAGIPTPNYVDGRSLRPLLTGSATAWRSAILLEAHKTRAGGETPAYYGIRTNDGRKYIEYEGGGKELYNLGEDPHELANKYNPNGPPTGLVSRLQALKACAGTSCRSAEDDTIIDTIKPSGTVLINNEATYTTSTAVTLKLSATDPAPGSGVSQMRFSNDGSTWSAWGTYVTTKGWTLSSANGTKTVYAQFRDEAGNVSTVANDTIVLDTVKPEVRGVQPAAGATGVPTGTNVVATFSEQMTRATLTNLANFKLYRMTATGPIQITNVTLTPSLDLRQDTLNPYGTSTTLLAKNTKYKVVVTTGVKDLAGNTMATQKVWYFTTRS